MTDTSRRCPGHRNGVPSAASTRPDEGVRRPGELGDDPVELDDVTGLGLALRPLPAPWHLPLHVVGVVSADGHPAANDLAADRLPVVAMAVAASAAAAENVGVAEAVRLRRRRSDPACLVGCGPDAATARHRAVIAALTCRARAVQAPTTGANRAPDTGSWSPGSTTLLERLRRHVTPLFRDEATLPGVSVTCCTIPAPGGSVVGLGVGADADHAEERALWAAAHRLVRVVLAPKDAAGPAHDAYVPVALERDGSDACEEANALTRSGVEIATGIMGRVDGDVVAWATDPAAAPVAVGAPRPFDAPTAASLVTPDRAVRLSRLYHANSKLYAEHRDLPVVDLAAMSPAVREVIASAARPFPPGADSIALPRRDEALAGMAVEDVLRRRRSWAPMTDESISLDRLGHLLHVGAGVTATTATPGSSVRLPLRAMPAAGGLFSTDLFVYARNVDSLERGVYYYDPLGHRLVAQRREVDDARVVKHVGYGPRASDAAAVLVYAASFRRLQWKYWERAYRMAHLDCGHLAQNLVVVAAGLRLVCHPMIAFVDDFFDDLLDLDGVDEACIYLSLLGSAAPVPQWAARPDAGAPGGGHGAIPSTEGAAP